jgi:transglutaminase-like putative cysteine protease
MTLPAGTSTQRFDAVVSVPDATEEVDLDAPETPVTEVPDEALAYTMPSRYVLPDVLGDEAWRLFGGMPPGYRRVLAICDHVHSHIAFTHGSSTPLTTAADVYQAGKGVCRDFAHLALSFCRALNIPARYVFGYLPEVEVEPLPEPMDFAAWIEVYLGGRWYTFDPRNNEARKGRVLIGRGRDALDVAMVTTFGGPVLEHMDVWAEELAAPPAVDAPPGTQDVEPGVRP